MRLGGKPMDDLKNIIGKNIQYLRKEEKMTQQDLAIKLNYTAKAISKWERGESIPEIETLIKISNIFNVTLDFLVKEDGRLHRKEYVSAEIKNKNNFFTTILLVAVVWTLAAIIYVYLLQIKETSIWQLFVWAVPISLVIIAISIRQQNRNVQVVVYSVFLWALLVAIFVQFNFTIPLIFLVGIPAQLALIFWSRIIRIK